MYNVYTHIIWVRIHARIGFLWENVLIVLRDVDC